MAETFPSRKCEREGCAARGDAVTVFNGREICRVDLVVFLESERANEPKRMAAFLAKPAEARKP